MNLNLGVLFSNRTTVSAPRPDACEAAQLKAKLEYSAGEKRPHGFGADAPDHLKATHTEPSPSPMPSPSPSPMFSPATMNDRSPAMRNRCNACGMEGH